MHADKTFNTTVAPPLVVGSVLANKANAMVAGTWDFITLAAVPQMDSSVGGSIFEYTEKACYDPIHKKIKYIGCAHTSGFGAYLEYREATNDFFQTGDSSGTVGPRHGFAYQAVNPNTGELFGGTSNATFAINRFADGTGSATTVSIPANGGSNNGQWYSLEWHPNLVPPGNSDSEGRLIALSMWQAECYRPSTGTWQSLASSTGNAGADAAGGHAYVIKDNCAYLGLSFQLFKVTAAGVVSQIAAPPVSVGCWSDPPNINQGTLCGGGLSTSDMVQIERDGRINSYSATGNSWTTNVDNWRSHIPDQAGNFIVACPIAAYGVIAFMTQTSNSVMSNKMWLWKR